MLSSIVLLCVGREAAHILESESRDLAQVHVCNTGFHKTVPGLSTTTWYRAGKMRDLSDRTSRTQRNLNTAAQPYNIHKLSSGLRKMHIKFPS